MLSLTELGTRLKEARLAKGFSLDDLQEITKIQKRYLVGIEEGNYSIMPGSFYVRAFIKQYAEAVGLDSDEILAEYKKDVPGSQSEEVAQSYTQSPSRRKLASSSSNRMMEMMPKIIVALFIVVIIIVIWTLYYQKAKNTPDVAEDKPPIQYDTSQTNPVNEEDDVETDTTITEDPVEEEPVEEQPVMAQVISPAVVNGDDVNFEVSGTDELKVRVEVTQASSWVAFRNTQGTDNLGKEYVVNDVVEYDATADKYVRIRLGRAANVNVYVNDELLSSPSTQVTQNFIIKLVQEQQTQ